jgi:sporulation protein YtfJ
MAYENKIQDIIKTSLENIRSMIDANTVVGNPINTESGTTIIPISKVSMGFASGGLDYNGKIVKPTPAPTGAQNFGGGGGTGLSVVPVGFLVVGADGSVSMINVGDKIPSDPVEQIIDLVERSPEIIDKIVSLIKKAAPQNPDESAPYKEKKSKK